MRNRIDISSLIATIVAVIILIIIAPAFVFFCGWIGGWIAKITFGGILVDGLNTLFHTDYFNKDMLPMITGTIAWIGSYFKTTNVKRKDS